MTDPKTLLGHIETLKLNRLRFEPSWYKSFYAYENNSFMMWSRSQQTLVSQPYRKAFFANLPEIKKQADGFENLLLTFMPLFVIYPSNISDDAKRKEAQGLSKLLKKHYIDWVSSNLVHEYVHTAIKYPVAFWEIGVERRLDPVTGVVKNQIVPSVADAFDYLFDPRVKFQDNQVIVKILRKTIREVQRYKDFKYESATGVTVAEDMKEMIWNSKYGPRTEKGDLQTIVSYQVMERTKDGIDMQIIDPKGNVLKKASYKGATMYPVVPLQLSSGDMYQPSFIENLMPICRMITLIVNRIESFLIRFTKGSYLVRDGSDVTFTDENAIKVTYQGDKPEVMMIPQLPPAVLDWLNRLFLIAERYGVNQVALGNTPRGSQNRSAKMMDKAVQNQQGQQKSALDNLMSAFKQIALITIYYLSEYTDEPINVTFRDPSGQEFEAASFIGQKYAGKSPNAIVIPKSIESMEVEIEDVSVLSIQSKKEAIFNLAKEWQAIPPPFQKVLLDLHKVGSTADIMEDLEKSQTLLDNPEFQALVAQARAGNLPPDVQQALADLLKFLSQQAPVPNTDKMGVVGKKPSNPTPSAAGKPAQGQAPQPAAVAGGDNAGQ